jgi:hypothetical protein
MVMVMVLQNAPAELGKVDIKDSVVLGEQNLKFLALVAGQRMDAFNPPWNRETSDQFAFLACSATITIGRTIHWVKSDVDVS